MSAPLSTEAPTRSRCDTGNNPCSTIRRSLDELDALDAATAEYLNALAFVLMRVADADMKICDRERRCIEKILVEHAGLRPEHAILVVEIARHRCRIADCGTAYGISRSLRTSSSPEHRSALARFLWAVGDADGHLDPRENRVISQIASELGCELSAEITTTNA